MPRFLSGQPATVAHAALSESLAELARVEQHAVLWFAEIWRRKLYRELGYSSIQVYAIEALGLSASKTSQFLRLAESMDRLPELRKSMARGEVSWTKAREIAKVATAKSEKQWIAKAKSTSSRELEGEVRHARDAARQSVKRPDDLGQGSLLPDSGATRPAVQSYGSDVPVKAVREADELCQPEVNELSQPEVALPDLVTSLRFRPEERARFDALIEKLQKRASAAGHRGEGREALVLAGLEALLEDQAQGGACEHCESVPGCGVSRTSDCNQKTSSEKFTRVKSGRRAERAAGSHSSYQIIVHRDESKGAATIRAGQRDVPLDEATYQRIACDARILEPGKRNRASIPPAVRRAVIARDRHRCQVPGCGNAKFLEVHHITPRGAGGGNDLGNLITLCSACHQLLHERGLAGGTTMSEWLRSRPKGECLHAEGTGRQAPAGAHGRQDPDRTEPARNRRRAKAQSVRTTRP